MALRSPRPPLPRHWSDRARSCVLHAISLAQVALTQAWSRAAESTSPKRYQAEIDRLRADVAHLQEEMEIKDSRWGRHSPRRRPHYGPIQRMRILQLRAARGWTVAQTAERLLLTEATIMNWMRQLDGGGEAALVRTPEPVNRYPDFVAYLVRRLKILAPSLGKKRIADMLARAGLHLGTSTVGRMLKRDLSRDDAGAALPAEERGHLKARGPNDIWHVDLTVVPTGGGFWAPWFPFTKFQRWPFCWWVAVCIDNASRALVGFAVFKTRPDSEDVCSFLARAVRKVGSKPRYIITDRGKEFDCWAFKSWCRPHIRQRFGAVGQQGSVAIVERFIRSMKVECTRRILVPFRLIAMRRELSLYATWYNEYRPHTWLGASTPAEVYRGEPVTTEAPRYEPRPRWTRKGKDRNRSSGARLTLALKRVRGRRHLPIVELNAA